MYFLLCFILLAMRRCRAQLSMKNFARKIAFREASFPLHPCGELLILLFKNAIVFHPGGAMLHDPGQKANDLVESLT
jgi:hypothetical protein